MSVEFFQTVMGRRFFEGDVPRIAEALVRIADNLAKKSAPEVAPSEMLGGSVQETVRYPRSDRSEAYIGERLYVSADKYEKDMSEALKLARQR